MAIDIQESGITGRGGIKIPALDFGNQTHPRLVPEFFRGLWTLNKYHTDDEYRDPIAFGVDFTSFGYRKEPDSDEMVLPASAEHPLTVIRYNYMPVEGRYNDPTETHMISIPPISGILGFDTLVKFAYTPSHNAGYAGARNRISVAYKNHAPLDISVYDEKDMSYTYDRHQQAQQVVIGAIMRDCVDFLAR